MIRILTKRRYEELLIAEQKLIRMTDRDEQNRFVKSRAMCPKCKHIYNDSLERCPRDNKVLIIVSNDKKKGDE